MVKEFICHSCDQQLPTEANFCLTCGAKIENSSKQHIGWLYTLL